MHYVIAEQAPLQLLIGVVVGIGISTTSSQKKAIDWVAAGQLQIIIADYQ